MQAGRVVMDLKGGYLLGLREGIRVALVSPTLAEESLLLPSSQG